MNRYSLGLCSVALAVLSAPLGCAVTPDDALETEEELVESTSQAITVSGLGHYCSGTWPGLGGWAFTSNTAGGDPCASITSTGGTVQRKGLYSASGVNRVVYRCNPPSYNWVGMYEGSGNGPLTAAYDAADGQSECIFTVSPVSIPIFDAPFSLSATYTHATGFDFAKAPYNTLNVTDFGQTGSTAATIVDWKGRDKSSGGFINGHDGHDWLMAKGTAIKAVADGTVVMARDWNSGYVGSDSPFQKEVAILHTVRGTAGSSYVEQFITYYAHLQSYSVVVGDTVTKGQQIGQSGNTGSSTTPHLHFGVIRVTNTADQLSETVTWSSPPVHSDGADQAIEPYGWGAPSGFDPWSWRGYPQGALSVALWNSGQAPSTGTW
ncbi:M23 family metallopeptidase [Sorangium sp. So ce1128]